MYLWDLEVASLLCQRLSIDVVTGFKAASTYSDSAPCQNRRRALLTYTVSGVDGRAFIANCLKLQSEASFSMCMTQLGTLLTTMCTTSNNTVISTPT